MTALRSLLAGGWPTSSALAGASRWGALLLLLPPWGCRLSSCAGGGEEMAIIVATWPPSLSSDGRLNDTPRRMLPRDVSRPMPPPPTSMGGSRLSEWSRSTMSPPMDESRKSEPRDRSRSTGLAGGGGSPCPKEAAPPPPAAVGDDMPPVMPLLLGVAGCGKGLSECPRAMVASAGKGMLWPHTCCSPPPAPAASGLTGTRVLLGSRSTRLAASCCRPSMSKLGSLKCGMPEAPRREMGGGSASSPPPAPSLRWPPPVEEEGRMSLLGRGCSFTPEGNADSSCTFCSHRHTHRGHTPSQTHRRLREGGSGGVAAYLEQRSGEASLLADERASLGGLEAEDHGGPGRGREEVPPFAASSTTGGAGVEEVHLDSEAQDGEGAALVLLLEHLERQVAGLGVTQPHHQRAGPLAGPQRLALALDGEGQVLALLTLRGQRVVQRQHLLT